MARCSYQNGWFGVLAISAMVGMASAVGGKKRTLGRSEGALASESMGDSLVTLTVTVASGLTAGTVYTLLTYNSLAGYLGIGCEL